MRNYWQSGVETGGFGLAPAALGVVLILLGLLLYTHPQLLAYFVAGMFVLAGCGLLGVAWRTRRQVQYRRMDVTGSAESPADKPPA